MSKSGPQPHGLLLAMMEPPSNLEDEFQHWYDSEHFPERQGTEGFLTATRLICLDGWPRYLALYDLETVDVLRGPGYAKIAGGNYSRWTERVVGRVWGQYRAEGIQMRPGNGLLGANGTSSRVVVWRFRHVDRALHSKLVDGFFALHEGQPEIAQTRLFESRFAAGTDIIGIVEQHAPWSPAPGSVRALGDGLKHLDMINTYTRYERRWPGDYPKNT
jgi:hypothetical protein